jgi:hypothetical protein
MLKWHRFVLFLIAVCGLVLTACDSSQSEGENTAPEVAMATPVGEAIVVPTEEPTATVSATDPPPLTDTPVPPTNTPVPTAVPSTATPEIAATEVLTGTSGHLYDAGVAAGARAALTAANVPGCGEFDGQTPLPGEEGDMVCFAQSMPDTCPGDFFGWSVQSAEYSTMHMVDVLFECVTEGGSITQIIATSTITWGIYNDDGIREEIPAGQVVIVIISLEG